MTARITRRDGHSAVKGRFAVAVTAPGRMITTSLRNFRIGELQAPMLRPSIFALDLSPAIGCLQRKGA